MRQTTRTAILPLLLLSGPVFAADPPPEIEMGAPEDRVRFYTTPREKREAGLGTKLTDWLSLYGLVEIEADSTKSRFRNNVKDSRVDDSTTTVQIGFKAEFDDGVEAEIFLEFEDDSTDSVLDEAFVELKKGEAGLLVGKQTLSFGDYISHFVTGPLLEFGETKRNALALEYDYHDIVEVSAFVYDGVSQEVGDEDRIRDWGAAIAATLFNNRMLLGASYISNLADSDDELLSDFDNMYQRKVGGWSAYAVVRPGNWEISIETVQATKAFQELPANANEPRAWNLEVTYFPAQDWEVSARYEKSRELADEPERRYGIGATWLAYKNVTISFEFLRGTYEPGFAFDDDGNELERQDIFATQLAMEF